jgi:hypothetical protein
LRAASGHKYWSAFHEDKRGEIERVSKDRFNLLFEPEADSPIKTLDLPLAGTVSPVDALSVLVELLTITTGEEEIVPARRGAKERVRLKSIGSYPDDPTGDATIAVLGNAFDVLSRITGNSPGSLGLHPAVYFYNERGKHSRFLFLGMALLIAEKIQRNDGTFFKKFTQARSSVENFLIENKSLISTLLTNMSKGRRVANTKDLLSFLVAQLSADRSVTPEQAMAHLGLPGRVFGVDAHPTQFPEDVKSMAYIKKAIESALRCPICHGLLDPSKSVSYDHRIPIRHGGDRNLENAQLVHPYCNTGVKN